MTDDTHSSRHRQARASGCKGSSKGTGAIRPLRSSSEGPIWRPVWHAHANIGRIVFMMPPASRSDYFGHQTALARMGNHAGADWRSSCSHSRG